MNAVHEKCVYWRHVLGSNRISADGGCHQGAMATSASDCLLVRVRDESSQYILQSSDNKSTVVTREEARRILTSNSRCKLLCEYIQQHKEDSENWDLRLILFFDNPSAKPSYFVEFTEHMDSSLLSRVREVSARVNVTVDLGDTFGVRWDLEITRGHDNPAELE